MTDFSYKEFFRVSAEWRALDEELRGTNRFFPNCTDFIDEVVSTCLSHNSRLTTAAEVLLFRARIMPWERRFNAEPYPTTEMGAPPPHLARGGRLNPGGIRYLYLASDQETALAEVRPWVEATVTVAEFQLPGRRLGLDASLHARSACPHGPFLGLPHVRRTGDVRDNDIGPVAGEPEQVETQAAGQDRRLWRIPRHRLAFSAPPESEGPTRQDDL